MATFSHYNDLLETSDLNNFHSSLGKPNGFTFNQLINILITEGFKFKILEGFNCNSSDDDIKEFNKIKIQIEEKDNKKWENICEIYSLYEVFNIDVNKNIFIIKAI